GPAAPSLRPCRGEDAFAVEVQQWKRRPPVRDRRRLPPLAAGPGCRLLEEEKKMIRNITLAFAALLFAFGLPVAAQDKSKGTDKEAIAMVEKAVAHIKKVGKEKAFADFNNKSGPFTDRDLYVV